MREQLQVLTEKPMSRREFLGFIGLAVISIFGITRFMKSLLHDQNSNASKSAVSPGSTAFGGRRR